MAGDYTRFTFNPTKGFSSVLKQQGRVSLDADANELEAIHDRRDRAGMYDTVGQAVYPMTTPNGFRIGVGAGGRLTIGQGRMYVDGILVECFGDMSVPANTVFDAQLNDMVGTNPLFYDQQPFRYTTPAFPTISPTAGDVNLLYLDVWQREVTVYEDPALREIALNGPDTATRMQTAWQVKCIPDPSALPKCVAPPPLWAGVTAPSTGRLTAVATPTLPAPGPCVISPAGGYTGLENRLYRVEVHTAGTVGGAAPATFKWSRDNASLAAQVLTATKVAATDWILTLGSTGRDSWMRFEFGDHIELLDDDVEFAMRESGRGGIMARVTSVNHATGEIHIDQDLTAFPIVASRHPRIRRWDIAAAAEPLVRNTSNGVAIALESGISVTFGSAVTDTLHAGDHWVFAARTADGTIDSVVAQPPRNTLHHYAPLALVTSGAPPTILSDCRIPWPPKEGCCTVVVQVGQDIQAAIDKLNGIGGCVCLKMGVHHIRAPLVISQSNVTLHGEVPLVTVVLDTGGPEMLRIGGAKNVSIEGILFQTSNAELPGAVIMLERVRGGRIADCGIDVSISAGGDLSRAIGIGLVGVHDYAIDTVGTVGLARVVRGQGSTEISVVDCDFAGPTEALAAPPGGTPTLLSLGFTAVQFDGDDLTGLYVERNTIRDYQRGIQLGDVALAAIAPFGGPGRPINVDNTQGGSRIVANTILRHDGPRSGTGFDVIAFAIAVHVARCEILENAVNLAATHQSGVLVAGGNVTVTRNEIRSDVPFDFNNPASQIPLGIGALASLNDALICSVRENLLTGVQQAIAVTGVGSTGRHRIDVTDNRIIGEPQLLWAAANGLLGGTGTTPFAKLLDVLNRFAAISVTELSRCRIEGNQMQTPVCGVYAVAAPGSDIARNRVREPLVGMMLGAAAAIEVSDNLIEGDSRAKNPPWMGIGLLFAQRSTVSRNVIRQCETGIQTIFTDGVRLQDNGVYETMIGIASIVDTDLDVRGNTIEDSQDIGIESNFSLHELTIAGNTVRRTGYREGSPLNVATGIAVLLGLSLVTVDGCHVIDTGESPDAVAPFTGQRHGIVVLFAIGSRVRGCEIASKPLLPGVVPIANSASRALRMWALPRSALLTVLGPVGRPMTPFADATDNVIEQSGQILVEMLSDGETMLASNRCMNFDASTLPSVIASGSVVTATGNRVRAAGAVPGIALVYELALSAIGNASSNGGFTVASAVGAVQTPAPYASFNVTT